MRRQVVVDGNSAQLIQSAIDSRRIVDEGGLPRTPIIREKTISFTRFVEKLVKNLGKAKRVVLPPNCRMYEACSDGGMVLVLEDEPSVRTVGFDMDFSSYIEELRATGKLEEYGLENFEEEYPERPYYLNLSFPYIVYILRFSADFDLASFKVFFRLHPLTSRSDYLFLANLPNIPSDQHMCLGVDKLQGSGVSMNTIIDACDRALYRFWSNAFNSDYINNVQRYVDTQYVDNFLTWSYYTSVDPMFIFDTKWIPHGNTIGEEVHYMGESDAILSFEKIIDMFISSEKVDEPGSLKINNLCDSIVIKDIILSVGDEIIYDGRPHYVVSFRGFPGADPSEVIIEDENGKEIVIDVDVGEPRSILDGWRDHIFNSNEVAQYIVGENEIKVDDIIRLTFPQTGYKQVKSLRYGRDGNVEAKLGKHYYLLENVDFEIINFNDVKVQGRILEIGKSYCLVAGNLSENTGKKITTLVYSGIATNGSDNVCAKFTSEREDVKLLPLDDFGYTIIDEENTIQATTVRLNGRIFSAYADEVIRIVPGIGCFSNLSWSSDSLQAKKDILKGENLWDVVQTVEDGETIEDAHLVGKITSIYVPSFDIDLSFSIGDEVVVADWEDVSNMLEIWKIKEFKYIDIEEIPGSTDDRLDVVVVNGAGKELTFPYIFFGSGKINIGYMRKAARSYKGIPVGTLIKANRAKVQNFPMKDIVEIKAFIMDTGRDIPLILCSNLCTLWASDASLLRFDAFPVNSPKWRKNKSKVASPDPKKIKLQSGDFVCINNMVNHSSATPYMIRRGKWARKYVVAGLSSGYRFTLYEDVRGNILGEGGYKRWGLVSPRDSQNEHFERKNISVWPNFHNWYRLNNFGGDGRRNVELYVSDVEFEMENFPPKPVEDILNEGEEVDNIVASREEVEDFDSDEIIEEDDDATPVPPPEELGF